MHLFICLLVNLSSLFLFQSFGMQKLKDKDKDKEFVYTMKKSEVCESNLSASMKTTTSISFRPN